MIESYSKNIDMQDLGLFWQLTIKTIDDLRIVGNENLTLEMYVMQLIHLKSIGFKKEAFNEVNIDENLSLKKNLIGEKIGEENLDTNLPTKVKNQLKSTDQIKSQPIKNLDKKNDNLKIEITSFQDLIIKANEERIRT